MEKTWADNEGRLRIEHDENYQMVSPFEVDSIWHLTDSWSIDQALHLILLGYNEDIKRSIAYGFEHCQEGSTGRDRAHALITIADRFMTLAKSSINAGTIREHDTPANWLEWAKGKGYSVSHLMPADAPSMKEKDIKQGITKQQVINAFEGLHFNRDQWTKALGKNIPNWLMECRVTPGVRGNKVSATWNPVLIAAALIDQKIAAKKLDAVFVHLKDWADEWQEKSALFRD